MLAALRKPRPRKPRPRKPRPRKPREAGRSAYESGAAKFYPLPLKPSSAEVTGRRTLAVGLIWA